MLADDECTWFGITCNPATNDVTRFEMGNNQMTGRFPAEIQLLSSSLEYLDIGSNTLDNKEGELTWIGEMTNLSTFLVFPCLYRYAFLCIASNSPCSLLHSQQEP
jgi:hypothetical protein